MSSNANQEQTTRYSAAQLGIYTMIADGVAVDGAIASVHGVKVDGKVYGGVRVIEEKGWLIVGKTGFVEGPVCGGGTVVVEGIVIGDVTGETVMLGPKARVRGRVTYKTIKMMTGASIVGEICQSDSNPAAQPKLAEPVASAEPMRAVAAA